jgi:hypothetical protein
VREYRNAILEYFTFGAGDKKTAVVLPAVPNTNGGCERGYVRDPRRLNFSRKEKARIVMEPTIGLEPMTC